MTICAPPLTLSAETEGDHDAVEALIAAAFGPGRYAKAAERLREGNSAVLDLCRVARMGGQIVGAVRLWPIQVGDDQALLLGPIAVDERHRKAGVGAALVRAACAAADAAGHGAILLVGDAPFFGPMGFSADAARGVVMPGPVDRRRVLARSDRPLDGAAGPFPREGGGPVPCIATTAPC